MRAGQVKTGWAVWSGSGSKRIPSYLTKLRKYIGIKQGGTAGNTLVPAAIICCMDGGFYF
ncbi:hypothetical protein A7D23_12940 [Dehalobacter sp. TeCB1]|uniref:Uncharacterized protein n=1 Tax=Dehalobacter restrictus (strain DSM 9455 / PER-K23) TaxID=871738 RepID=A0ABN4C0R5_DEHRP|nr:hypothetical protein DEHRE_03150 [Dehalobacter restrictus DSM 9455]OCZ51419.1 hypothetical protein A7D23_12940 [Dehalobacter sp. TeCB1]